MPRRERSFAQEIEERIAAGAVADEEAARAAVVDDLATGRLEYRCNFEGGILRIEPGIEMGFGDFRPVNERPSYAWNLWQQIRAGELNRMWVEFSSDNKTITAGNYRIVDIFVWDRDEMTTVPGRRRAAPVRRGLSATAPAPQSHGAPASAKRQPGDTDKARAELLHQAAKPHVRSMNWTADIAFAAGREKFPNNRLLLETSPRTERKAWLFAKRKLREEA